MLFFRGCFDGYLEVFCFLPSFVFILPFNMTYAMNQEKNGNTSTLLVVT